MTTLGLSFRSSTCHKCQSFLSIPGKLLFMPPSPEKMLPSLRSHLSSFRARMKLRFLLPGTTRVCRPYPHDAGSANACYGFFISNAATWTQPLPTAWGTVVPAPLYNTAPKRTPCLSVSRWRREDDNPACLLWAPRKQHGEHRHC